MDNKQLFSIIVFGSLIATYALLLADNADNTANTALQPPPVVCTNFTFLQSFGGNTTICNTVPLQGTLSYFFTNQTSVNTLSPSKRMLVAPDSNLTTQITYVNPTDMRTFQNWTTKQGLPQISFIPAGSYRVHVHASINKPNFAMIFAEVWEVNNTGVPLGLIGTTEHENLTDNAETEFDMDFTTNNTWFMNSTQSRLQVQIFAHILQDNPDITLYFDGTTNARLSLPSQTVDASNFVPYIGATQDVNLSTHNITANKVIANNVNSGYFREFWQFQGTAAQGNWAWFMSSMQTDFASVRGDPNGFFLTTTFNNLDEYEWQNVYLGAGTYNISVVTYKNTDLGIMEVLWGSTSLGTFDNYNSVGIFNVKVTFPFTINNTQTNNIRIRTNGKNASSSRYGTPFSRFWIEKVGEA